MRTAVEFRSGSKDNYKDFCKKYPDLSLTYDEWRNILYSYNDSFREYLLQTGEKAKLPLGIGQFAIVKKKRKKMIVKDGKEIINLPVDWKKSKEKGKKIYNFNFHTEGYFFGWVWFRKIAMFKQADLWYFKATRTTSRLLAHYLKSNNECQYKYQEWKFK